MATDKQMRKVGENIIAKTPSVNDGKTIVKETN